MKPLFAGRQKAVVIGLGSFGGTVARELMRLGCEVLGVDQDELVVQRFADALTHAVTADGANEHTLEELGLQSYDVAVVAIGEDIEASILATLLLKRQGVPQVWAKARNLNHHRILQKVGADRVTHPEHDSGLRVAQRLFHPDLVDFMNFGGGLLVVEVRAPQSLWGRTFSSLELGQVRLIACHRDGELLVDGDAVLERPIRGGDRFLLAGRAEELQALATHL
jgi:trk system potassium uptake protein TrkA